jgi:hypothetical protein
VHRILPGPETPPWTDEQLDEIVERAVRYIEEAKQRWGMRLGLAVGVWLYRELYGEDDAYLRSRDPGKERSLYDIAKRTGKSARTLRTWVWAGRMKVRLEAMGFASESLTLSDWAALHQLRETPVAARQVAEWIHAENPTIDEVRDRVRGWKAHGGEPPPRRKKHKKKSPRRRKKPHEHNLLRVMELVRGWVEQAEISKPLRDRLLAEVRGIKAVIQGRA